MSGDSLNCGTCSEYNSGEGTKECFRCPTLNNAVHEPRNFVPVCKSENIEDLSDYYSVDLIEALQMLDLLDSTMILQSHFLKMPQRAIAEFHNLPTTTVNRRIKRALETVQQIII